MRAFVFTDRSLASQAGRFAWLEMNTERAVNARLRKKFPVEALPTFFVIDPADEKVALRWVGGLTVGQLRKVLDDGRAAVSARHGGAAPGPQAGGSHPAPDSRDADAAFAHAEQLYGEANNAEAAKAYQDALAQAPEGWPHY